MQKVKIIMTFALVSTLLFFFSSTLQAAIVSVPATASGGFGSQGNPGSTRFVLGHTFSSSGEMISISASGGVNLSINTRNVGPDGISAPAGTPFAFTISYTPLEEPLVESGALIIPRPNGDTIEKIGALIGAYIPEPIANDPNFSPFDEDLVNLGIPSTDLFLIGSQATLRSPGAGALYLGINEWFASNNSGAFQVTIDPVPIPPAVWLFGSGLVGLVGIRKNFKK